MRVDRIPDCAADERLLAEKLAKTRSELKSRHTSHFGDAEGQG